MKQRLFFFALLVALVAILASGTLAYFNAEGTARNVITAGAVDVEVEEWREGPNGLEPWPGERIEVMPGTIVSKIAAVKNLEAEAWVRARVEMILTDADEQPMELPEGIISLNMNTADWTQVDGWWYCTAPLGTDDATAPLFTEVHFDGPNMTNEYQSCQVEITVIAQGVQTAHNGTAATDAAGWPAE